MTRHNYVGLNDSAASCQASGAIHSDSIHFKPAKGFKVHGRKSHSSLGLYTKLRSNRAGHLRLDKKKYKVKAQDVPLVNSVPTLSAPAQSFDDVDLAPIDTLPPQVDPDLHFDDSSRKRYASVSICLVRCRKLTCGAFGCRTTRSWSGHKKNVKNTSTKFYVWRGDARTRHSALFARLLLLRCDAPTVSELI